MTSEDRERAPGIYRALQWAHDAAAAGDAVTADDLQNGVRRRIAESGGRVDYVEVCRCCKARPVKLNSTMRTWLSLCTNCSLFADKPHQLDVA